MDTDIGLKVHRGCIRTEESHNRQTDQGTTSIIPEIGILSSVTD